MSTYELDPEKYKGFTIRIINDEGPEEPDWGGEDVFLVRTEKTRYRMGKSWGYEDPHRFIPWGEGPWAAYNDILRREAYKTPPPEWEIADELEKNLAWELHEEWKDDHSTEFCVWPLWAGDVHGPGSFELRPIDIEEYERADLWAFVRDDRSDVQKLADVEDERKDIDPYDTLEASIKQYEQWANGDVWGYVIEDSDGEEIDSCWGHYGSDYCLKSAKEAVDHLVKTTETRALVALYGDGTWASLDVEVPFSVGHKKTAEWVTHYAPPEPKPLVLFNSCDGVEPVKGDLA